MSAADPAARRAVLLLNTGSPMAPTRAAVRSYLRRFLNDPRVVDLPAVARRLLVEAAIVPLRAGRSARRYRAIWTERGSPLDLHTAAQARGLRARLPGTLVAHAMRYGSPSIEAAMLEFARRSVTGLAVVPMWPQYAAATVGSAVAEVYRCAAALPFIPAIRVLPPFFAEDLWLEAVAAGIRGALATFGAEQLLLSYHGLPVRQLRAATRITGGRCDIGQCCATLRADNFACYRAQCFATTAALVPRLPPLPSSTVFQSRLRGTRWSGPHLEERVVELARAGVRRLAVACPGFPADNLETLHDVAIDARAAFRAAGGEDLLAVPCLNDDRGWLDGLAGLVRREFGFASVAPHTAGV